MTDVAGSSFTDLLINQPILVWSLAGGISILVVAGFLSLFLSVRSRAQQKQTEKEAAEEALLAEVESVHTAVSELQTIAEDDEPDEKGTAVYQASIETVTLGSDGEEGAETANFVQTGPAEGDQAAAVTEEKSHESEGEEEVSELASLFEVETIIDPHVQALRDNLPAVSIKQLLTDIQSISAQLQERIDAVPPSIPS